jgi:hypothetical protein
MSVKHDSGGVKIVVRAGIVDEADMESQRNF